ncbi:phage holin family protein [Candidatus Saccharibacteria bacterium]|nr:phage holin family protein [Candidatus Saccharibacteria bacterium]
MVKNQILIFLLRWAFSSAGMWLCITLFGHLSSEPTFWLFVVAGLVFSLVNSIVKPLATLISLPLIILTMGIFVVIINTAMVGLTIWIMPGVEIGFGGAVLSALTMSMINYLVNLLVPEYNRS